MLSRRQQDILRFLYTFSQQHGYYPTIREIGDGVGIESTSVVSYNLKHLVKHGYLLNSQRRSRTMRLTDKGCEAAGGETIRVVNDAIETARAELVRLRIEVDKLRRERDALADDVLGLREEAS